MGNSYTFNTADYEEVLVEAGLDKPLAKESGAFFGLYAMASTATAWIGPLAIGYFTYLTGTQQGGFAPVVLFFVAGLIGLAFVKRSDAASV